jgi:serine/threonine protein kinase
MVIQPNRCDRDRLLRLTEDQLAPDEIGQLEHHVHTCQSCQAELERLAVADRWFGAARKYLGAEKLTQPYDSSPLNEISLDFLDPSDWPDSLGRLGNYEIKSVVGRGGMGVVLKAVDPALNRTVAIKVLATHLAVSGTARARFLREARAAAAVVHEHVVAVHAVNEAKGLPYLVMEYVPGGSLQDRIDRQGPLSIAVVLRIGMQAAAGLAIAHSQGLVHRDVKPANILLDEGVERSRLTDFGLARAVSDADLTQSGVVTGTPHYMAPEQARAELVDHRSDLFSLGSTLYAMCTGYPPFRADSAVAILRRVSDDMARPLREVNASVPEWLEAIIARLHAKDPSERYQSAAEVANLLAQCLAYLQQPTKVFLPDALRQKPKRGKRARFLPLIVTSIVLISVAILVTLILPTEPKTVTNVTDDENADRPLVAPPAHPATQSRIERSDEIDEQIQVIRQRTGMVKAELGSSNGSQSMDRMSEEIRNVLMEAKKLEQVIQSNATGAIR